LLVGALTTAAGCVSLTSARVPQTVLDGGANNGWVPDPQNSTDVTGDTFSKRGTNAYLDDADDGEGHPGRLTVRSVRGVLSPDREELRERLAEQLERNAERNGLERSTKLQEGERRLANDALSFFVTYNASASNQESVFASDAEIRMVGEVFRCTGGATVVITGTAQISESESVGGVQTEENFDPETWAEIVRDPEGTIDGYRGASGLIDSVRCGE